MAFNCNPFDIELDDAPQTTPLPAGGTETAPRETPPEGASVQSEASAGKNALETAVDTETGAGFVQEQLPQNIRDNHGNFGSDHSSMTHEINPEGGAVKPESAGADTPIFAEGEKEGNSRYTYSHRPAAAVPEPEEEEEDDREPEEGFWSDTKTIDYSVGLHGSNTDFVTKMNKLLASSVKAGITDIHITEKKHVWVRTAGDMLKLNIVTPQGGLTSFCSDVLRIPASYDKANSSCEHSGKRLRLRFSKSMHNNQLFVRILPGRAVPLDKIGHTQTFEFLRGKIMPGIVFVAGATGSGKSTMLASVLQEYLDTEPVHISTVEDPVEYLLFDGVGEVSQREVPDDTPDFATAVKNVLREDPDIIFIGEMRDPETAKTALTAAETGHLVFATVHASGISGIIDRLLGMLADVNDAALRLSGAFLGGIYLKLEKQPDGNFLRKTRFLFADNDVRSKIREMRGFELDDMGVEIINK